MRRRQVVFIGICAGDKHLIREWVTSGDLPNIGRLLAQGLQGDTAGLPGVYVGAHWPSFVTGCHPGKNRVHSWSQLTPGTYEEYRCLAGDVMQRRPFWDWLSEAGRRVCVLDVPHSKISPRVNGLQTVEWGAHDGAYGFHSSSAALDREVRETFGLHPVSGNSDAARTPEQLAEFRDDLVRGVHMKGALTRHFYKKERWDFFAQVFTEAHCAGHLLWHVHDPAYRWHLGNDIAGGGNPVKAVYIAIDEEIGRFLDVVEDDAYVILLANHGMRAKHHASHLLERALIGLGHAAPRPRPEPPRGVRETVDPAMTWVWQRLPGALRDRLRTLRDLKRQLVNPEQPRLPLIEAAESRAFTVTNNSAHGAIRVNLIGREPAGKVAPGVPYEALLDQITSDLMRLTNLETGAPIVRAVYRCDEHYAGPERSHLPDLFVDWKPGDDPVRAIGSDRLARVEGRNLYVRSGEHHPDGLFVATGLGRGRIGRTVGCVDFAPTIAAMLGVAPDGDIDGKPIAELAQAAA